MARLEEWFKKYARGRGVMMAEALAKEMRAVVGVQAPIKFTASDRAVAAIPATPLAPPRRVTGNLQSKIRVVRTAHGARVVSWAPYSSFLEYRTGHGFPHKFVEVALRKLGLSS